MASKNSKRKARQTEGNTKSHTQQDMVQELIKKYRDRLESIINPDGFTSWEDADFDGPVEGYDTLLDCLRGEGEWDEGQQTEMAMCDEIIEDLEKLKKSTNKPLQKENTNASPNG